jgi:hypothetical protein
MGKGIAVSNIRPEGLGCEAAARRIDWIAAAGVARGVTGVGLKDESGGKSGSEHDFLREGITR